MHSRSSARVCLPRRLTGITAARVRAFRTAARGGEAWEGLMRAEGRRKRETGAIGRLRGDSDGSLKRLSGAEVAGV